VTIAVAGWVEARDEMLGVWWRSGLQARDSDCYALVWESEVRTAR